MPASPKPDSLTLSLRVKRTLMKRLCKVAEKRHEKVSATVRHLLNEAVKDTVLTPEDYAQIAKDTQDAINRRRKGDKPSQAQLAARNSSRPEKASRGSKNDAR